MTKTYPILGFAPDLPPDTPGILTQTQYVLPTEQGIGPGLNVRNVTDSVSAQWSDASPYCLGAAALPTMNGDYRYFMGTATALYESNVAFVATFQRASGLAVVNAPDTWSFAQYGDISLATSPGNPLLKLAQSSDSAFTAVSGAPSASIVVTVGLPNAAFVMLFGYDAGSGVVKDGIFWSGIGNYTAWTPDIGTQCGNVRLTDVNGGFTAALAYRDGVIAWKDHSMHIGSYVGGSAIWAWTTLSKDIGCLGKYACCVADDIVYFANKSGIWMYDGSYPRRVPGSVQRYWRKNVASAGQPGVVPQIRWRKSTRQLFVGGNGTNATANTPDWLVYQPESQLWTRYGNLSGDSNVAFVLDDGLMTATSTTPRFAALGDTAFAGASLVYTNAFGDPFAMTTLRGVRPVFTSGPADSSTGWLTGTAYSGPSLRNLFASAATQTFAPDATEPRLDAVISGRYVAAQMRIATPTWEMSGIGYDLISGGNA